MQIAKGNKGVEAGIGAWLRSRDPDVLAQSAQQDQGSVSFVLDGKQIALKLGVHFAVPS